MWTTWNRHAPRGVGRAVGRGSGLEVKLGIGRVEGEGWENVSFGRAWKWVCQRSSPAVTQPGNYVPGLCSWAVAVLCKLRWAP